MASYNVKQLTNFDVQDNPYVDPSPWKGHKYYKISYQQMLGIEGSTDAGIQIDKLGYCVNDNEGINYPIFINFTSPNNDIYEDFQIGKTGMFEFQPEKWMDVNENVEDEHDEDAEVKDATVNVYGLLVPDGVPFVLDYCFLV